MGELRGVVGVGGKGVAEEEDGDVGVGSGVDVCAEAEVAGGGGEIVAAAWWGGGAKVSKVDVDREVGS